MKSLPYVIVCLLFSFIWFSIVTAEPNSTTEVTDPEIRAHTPIQGEQIIPPRVGISWKEKVMMQREIKKRAQASRNALMREAEMERRNESRKTMQKESQVEP